MFYQVIFKLAQAQRTKNSIIIENLEVVKKFLYFKFKNKNCEINLVVVGFEPMPVYTDQN